MSEPRTVYRVHGWIEIREECLLPFADFGYVPPSSDEVCEILRRGGLGVSDAANLLGVDSEEMQTWVGGEREIPYSAWRLLAIYVGLARDGNGWQITEKSTFLVAEDKAAKYVA